MKNILVAYDRKRGIGADNDLLWQRELPADLKRFKELTTHQTIIMGRKTLESIGFALPMRQNIVVSRQDLIMPNVHVVSSIEAAYEAADPNNETFIIGGGEIYRQTLLDADRIYTTEVDAEFPNATVFFPVLPEGWVETDREHHGADEHNKYDFDFVTYDRS